MNSDEELIVKVTELLQKNVFLSFKEKNDWNKKIKIMSNEQIKVLINILEDNQYKLKEALKTGIQDDSEHKLRKKWEVLKKKYLENISNISHEKDEKAAEALLFK